MTLCARNIEIKAKVNNIDEIITKAKQLSGGEGIKLYQKDTFYHTCNGGVRLKLREEGDTGILISYSRPNTEGPKLSKYQKCEISDSSGLSIVLQNALGVKGIVKKLRLLFMVGQTRIHIDQVEHLGNFMELEVMLKDDQSHEEGETIAQQLMEELGVMKDDLCSGAYMDMLLLNLPQITREK